MLNRGIKFGIILVFLIGMSSCNESYESSYFIQSKRSIVTPDGSFKIKSIEFYSENLQGKDTCFTIEFEPPKDGHNVKLIPAFRNKLHLSFDSIYLNTRAFSFDITIVFKNGIKCHFSHWWFKSVVKSDSLKIPFEVL
jgi:hypothetical protein